MIRENSKLAVVKTGDKILQLTQRKIPLKDRPIASDILKSRKQVTGMK